MLFALLVGTVRQVSFSDISAILRNMTLSKIMLLGLLNLGVLLLFNLRWSVFLRASEVKVPFLSLFAYRLAGFGVSYFTPGPQVGGEPVQVYLLTRRHGISTNVAVAGVMLDRLIEFMVNTTLLGVGLAVVLSSGLLPGLMIWQNIPFVLGIVGLACGYLLLLRSGKQPLSAILHVAIERMPAVGWLRHLNQSVFEAEELVGHIFREKPGLVLTGVGFSVLSWFLMVVEFSLMINFLGQSFTLIPLLVAFSAARIAFLLPSPGGLGTLEASQILGMSLIGVPVALGLSLSLLIRGRDVLVGTAGILLAVALSRQQNVNQEHHMPGSGADIRHAGQNPGFMEVYE
jgi:uncharacterized protein (TIRG00374 family)